MPESGGFFPGCARFCSNTLPYWIDKSVRCLVKNNFSTGPLLAINFATCNRYMHLRMDRSVCSVHFAPANNINANRFCKPGRLHEMCKTGCDGRSQCLDFSCDSSDPCTVSAVVHGPPVALIHRCSLHKHFTQACRQSLFWKLALGCGQQVVDRGHIIIGKQVTVRKLSIVICDGCLPIGALVLSQRAFERFRERRSQRS